MKHLKMTIVLTMDDGHGTPDELLANKVMKYLDMCEGVEVLSGTTRELTNAEALHQERLAEDPDYFAKMVGPLIREQTLSVEDQEWMAANLGPQAEGKENLIREAIQLITVQDLRAKELQQKLDVAKQEQKYRPFEARRLEMVGSPYHGKWYLTDNERLYLNEAGDVVTICPRYYPSVGTALGALDVFKAIRLINAPGMEKDSPSTKEGLDRQYREFAVRQHRAPRSIYHNYWYLTDGVRYLDRSGDIVGWNPYYYTTQEKAVTAMTDFRVKKGTG